MSEGEDKEHLLDESSVDKPSLPQFSEGGDEDKIDISKTSTRHVMLSFAVFLCFGSYYVYDNPSALQTQLQDKLDISSFEFNMLYSIYSFPNFILPLFGGYIIDAIGVRIGIMIFGCLVVAGQCVFAFGVDIKSYPVALIGRFIFGLGGESLNVGQSAIVSSWFAGKDLAMALGVNVSISRLGSVFNDITEPAMDSATGSPDFGLWVGAVVCGCSLCCGLVLVYLDKKRDRLMGVKEKRKLDPSEQVKLSDIRHFGIMYWLISINCLVVYVCVMSFNNIATNFFQVRFGFSKVASGVIISITYIVAAIVCPFFGAVVDRIGKRTFFILLSAVLATLVHIIFISLPDCDQCVWGAFDLVILGISYSIYATVIWACIPYVVPTKTVGTAFGVTTAVQNIGLACGPLIIGAIHDGTSKEHGYFYVSLFLIMVGCIGVATAVFLFSIDKSKGGILYSNDPRIGLVQNIGDVQSQVDEDLPENIKQWQTSPESQKALRASMSKVALHAN